MTRNCQCSSRWVSQVTCHRKHTGVSDSHSLTSPWEMSLYQSHEFTKWAHCFNLHFWLLKGLNAFLHVFFFFTIWATISASYLFLFFVLVLFSPALICLFVLNWGSSKSILDIHFLCFQEVFSAECVVYLFVLFTVSLVIDCVVIMYSYI